MIYHAYIDRNRDCWNGYSRYGMGYWNNPMNAWKAIAERMLKEDGYPLSYLCTENGFERNPPDSYTFQNLIDDISKGIVKCVNICDTEYTFIVEEIKTED